MKQNDRAFCLPLASITDEAVGGKAEGLVRLRALGLRVPDAFVVVGARPGALPDDLEEAYRALGGGPVAVRSSALDEDGSGASFAGQYETVLGVEGEAALRAAIERCLASAAGARAAAYRDERAGGGDATMVVLVQRMVDARAAGVLFTVDPVSGRRDRWVIDAVAGLGEALVSGHATPDHYVIDPRGAVVERTLEGDEAVLSPATIAALREGAAVARAAAPGPIDMEWAIDARGTVEWLQARPVTTLPADPAELDTAFDADSLYTKCNIGEMMPGAVTPLTASTTGRGIDVGLQSMYQRIGARRAITPANQYVGVRFGHFFLDLTAMAEVGRSVVGSTPEAVALAICGRRVDGLHDGALGSFAARAANGMRYAAVLFGGRRHRERLNALVRDLHFPSATDPRVAWEAIDRRIPALHDAYTLHLLSSAGAGAMAPALLRVVEKNEPHVPDPHARVAELLAGADGVESADIAAGADRIVALLRKVDGARAAFAGAPVDEALAFLRSPGAGAARAELERYLARHGHRAVRELEMRQPGWAADPRPLVLSLKAALRAALDGDGTMPPKARAVDPSTLDATLRRMLPLAHAAVRGREESKSLLVRTTARFKDAYRALGRLLAERGLLPDEDAVFFLTHAELGAAARGRSPELGRLAAARRAAIDFQTSLVFDDVVRGTPEPMALDVAAEDGALVGQPVSRGVVRGVARVVRTLEEASAIERGEILIAPVTDVGWTPYFSAIAGLATDVGSAVSHGSVVAREYGLPAVVNLRHATRTFRTGELVELDGDRGILRRA